MKIFKTLAIITLLCAAASAVAVSEWFATYKQPLIERWAQAYLQPNRLDKEKAKKFAIWFELEGNAAKESARNRWDAQGAMNKAYAAYNQALEASYSAASGAKMMMGGYGMPIEYQETAQQLLAKTNAYIAQK